MMTAQEIELMQQAGSEIRRLRADVERLEMFKTELTCALVRSGWQVRVLADEVTELKAELRLLKPEPTPKPVARVIPFSSLTGRRQKIGLTTEVR